MNNNFFQKHLVTIIITSLFGIAIIIGFYQGFNDYQNEKNYLSPLENKPQQIPSKIKRSTEETPQPKIKTTAARFDQIKTYVFSESDDNTLLPNDLSEEEKTEIEKIKQKLINNLKFCKDCRQPWIDEYQTKINNLESQRQPLISQIEELKKQLTSLEQQLKIVASEKKEKEKSVFQLWDETQRPALEELRTQEGNITKQISEIKSEIEGLESKYSLYSEQIRHMEDLKQDSIKSLNRDIEQDKKTAESSLNSIYTITSTEG
ncbi:hypothetical protein LFWB_5870 [Candidatus Phytoplasma luffae]|uniref:Effector n=1 Tax=Loofah witches'-broom phytoplasma TaxID=35773 RepID=A0A975FIL9_LOWBP|nr:hypothetical protein [Candidatus Phytoplasma luffae]QTX02605.1 hypothetical protein LFWB_0350 [Candidatus Phytoplasma luffae]QTX03032.1 hypothetical protein LFWB_4660 [Candidatus Phytoplasma luffae]QTX03153.1 hypothetical protein LFWB_5870 [Candidatus Phytoplasma luffae]